MVFLIMMPMVMAMIQINMEDSTAMIKMRQSIRMQRKLSEMEIDQDCDGALELMMIMMVIMGLKMEEMIAMITTLL